MPIEFINHHPSHPQYWNRNPIIESSLAALYNNHDYARRSHYARWGVCIVKSFDSWFTIGKLWLGVWHRSWRPYNTIYIYIPCRSTGQRNHHINDRSAFGDQTPTLCLCAHCDRWRRGDRRPTNCDSRLATQSINNQRVNLIVGLIATSNYRSRWDAAIRMACVCVSVSDENELPVEKRRLNRAGRPHQKNNSHRTRVWMDRWFWSNNWSAPRDVLWHYAIICRI